MNKTTNFNPFSDRGNRQAAFGFLAIDCVEDVHRRLDEMIGGGESYVWVGAYEYSGYRPEVRTGQVAEKVQLINHTDATNDRIDHVLVQVLDTYGVWSLSSSLPTQPPSTSYDLLRRGMYLTFDRGHLKVQLRTGEGKLAWWVIAPEGER